MQVKCKFKKLERFPSSDSDASSRAHVSVRTSSRNTDDDHASSSVFSEFDLFVKFAVTSPEGTILVQSFHRHYEP